MHPLPVANFIKKKKFAVTSGIFVCQRIFLNKSRSRMSIRGFVIRRTNSVHKNLPIELAGPGFFSSLYRVKNILLYKLLQLGAKFWTSIVQWLADILCTSQAIYSSYEFKIPKKSALLTFFKKLTVPWKQSSCLGVRMTGVRQVFKITWWLDRQKKIGQQCKNFLFWSNKISDIMDRIPLK